MAWQAQDDRLTKIVRRRPAGLKTSAAAEPIMNAIEDVQGDT